MFTDVNVVKMLSRLVENTERIVKGQEEIINALAEIKESQKTESDDGRVYDASYQIKQMKHDQERDRFCTADGGPFSHC